MRKKIVGILICIIFLGTNLIPLVYLTEAKKITIEKPKLNNLGGRVRYFCQIDAYWDKVSGMYEPGNSGRYAVIKFRGTNGHVKLTPRFAGYQQVLDVHGYSLNLILIFCSITAFYFALREGFSFHTVHLVGNAFIAILNYN